ncbi:hypothetical protein GCM10017673_22760 [Streptosporangium violaceochromogenes]|nr:hypothetical protein GCM10017673_22760 [Streptosporangium violaceochromogenes]
MLRPLGLLACLGSLAALSTPIATAQAAASTRTACRVYVAKPYVTPKGRIQASAARLGCQDVALVRLQIRRVEAGLSRSVKSTARRGSNGRITATLSCVPGLYYATAFDDRGHASRSAQVRLTCPANTPPLQGPSPQAEVVRLTNAERRAGGCAPLRDDPRLRSSAQGHSSDMAAGNYFSHTSRDGRSMTDRIRASGFSPMRAWAENIAMGQRTPAEVVRAWMNSAGHRRNIMNCAYTHIGVGVAKSPRGLYWTQNFGRH